jgi:hypothetical protein
MTVAFEGMTLTRSEGNTALRATYAAKRSSRGSFGACPTSGSPCSRRERSRALLSGRAAARSASLPRAVPSTRAKWAVTMRASEALDDVGDGIPPFWARWCGTPQWRHTIGVEKELMLLQRTPDHSLAPSGDAVLARLSRELFKHTSPETHASVIELAPGDLGIASVALMSCLGADRCVGDRASGRSGRVVPGGLRFGGAGTRPNEVGVERGALSGAFVCCSDNR